MATNSELKAENQRLRMAVEEAHRELHSIVLFTPTVGVSINPVLRARKALDAVLAVEEDE